jgi:hypothetical protein
MDFSLLADKYLQSVSKKTLKKGERIYEETFDEITYMEESESLWLFDIPSESSNAEYQVSIELPVMTKGKLIVECDCLAFDDNGECKHSVAAVKYWEEVANLPFEEEYDEISNGEQKEAKIIQLTLADEVQDKGFYTVQMASIENWRLYQLAGNPPYHTIRTANSKIEIIDKTSAHHRFYYRERAGLKFEIDIIYNGVNEFKTKCNCDVTTNPICPHILAAFTLLEDQYGSHYFNRFRDYTKEKSDLLAKYGLKPEDSEAKLFEWGYNYSGNLILTKAPDHIRPKGDTSFIEKLKHELLKNSASMRPRLNKEVFVDYEIGFVLNFTNSRFLNFELDGAYIREKKGKIDIKRLNIHKADNWAALQSLDTLFFHKVKKFSEPELQKWVSNQTSRYGYLSLSSIGYSDEKDQRKLKRYYFNILKDIWKDLAHWDNAYLLKEGRFSNANIVKAEIKTTPAKLQFKVQQEDKFITIEPRIALDEEKNAKITFLSGLVFAVENRLYLAESYDLIDALSNFSNGVIKFPTGDKANVIKNIVLPLKLNYTVDIDPSLDFEEVRKTPEQRVTLSELNNEFLLIKPQFLYEETLLDYDDRNEHIIDEGNTPKIIHRDKEKEKALYEQLRTLHPKFANQRNNLYYYLPFGEVMKGGWYLKMIRQLNELGIAIYGLQDLKQFKYNTNPPKINFEAGSGIDWFDLQISIQWGDQVISLRELRKAILNEQTAVLLDDGTMGIIPEEWFKQYSLLLRIGNEEGGKLKISKMHFSVLDELGDQLGNKDVLAEIADKKQRLIHFDKIKAVKPSKEIKATLRPYQLAGFQWLQTLNGIGWGGCLADDMGLGKTLQTITFLQYLKERNPGSTQLVICPTSLIFNWENEIKKFCPTLKYHTYYGVQRSFDDEHFEKFDVILTSYGVLRIDLKHLTQFKWDYVILDESQAIKNPQAQITKSVQLLPCNNRLILSGTPVQNNTGDLYAQFNFTNPGLLGNWDFFKREFANDIDKNGDKEKTLQLRKLIYPFLLRRTKEQVAKDLPDKTEMILWCNMSKEQRKVYDEYKNYYRNALLKKIDEEGLGKAGIYVLEGLLKLRQICDHPSLVKDKEVKAAPSVKTEELLREIQENTGDHKLLVFSQFTEMLGLIENDLKANSIEYCYLDGSTPTPKRQQQVEEFQTNPNIKVFLISLKAGGVGLNLTAADYVYLVDPWWNPAAEQQAIDRTHRIGQTKKIFAYKMICKDTIEEKILNLQEKKKNLSGDLVSEDAGFVKKLTRDDIEFLFT